MAPQSTINTTHQPVHSQDSNMSTGTEKFCIFGRETLTLHFISDGVLDHFHLENKHLLCCLYVIVAAYIKFQHGN
jgi:hypothetical protein